jgi:protein involved in polysaccharide export with SLBB domain
MDPSVVGRWENTPSKMPILDRIASIEDTTGDIVEFSDPTSQDLIPQPRAYRFGPGDTLRLTAYDLVQLGTPEVFELTVDARGFIEVPQLGRIIAEGRTSEELRVAVETEMRRLLPDPLASVQAISQRESTFNLIGAVTSPGPYFIPKADYRLLEAIHTGGRFDESTREVYVIRQVPLYDRPAPSVDSEQSSGRTPQGGGTSQPARGSGTSSTPDTSTDRAPGGPSLVDIIDEIAGPGPSSGGTTEPNSTTPSAPAPAPAPAPVPAPGEPGSTPPAAAPAFFTAASQDAPQPVIDLPEPEAATGSRAAQRQSQANAADGWVYLNGKWVQVRGGSNATGSIPPGPSGVGNEPQQVMTQRVIRIPMDQLLAGRQSVNIVVLPGDVIRIPSTESGLVYVSGQVARPGSYGIPAGGLTLKQALTSAGGLGSLAIPERVDLVRRIGRDQEATIRLNARAIYEATQPDIFLKPNDQVNVGTNFWALPAAVFRSGLRASYGFGFLLDRNFGNDVFGAPPDNRGF